MCPMRTPFFLLLPDFPPHPPKTRYVMTSGGSRQWPAAPTNRHEILPLKNSSDSFHPQLSLFSSSSCTSHFILSSLGLSFRNHTFVTQRPLVSYPLYPRSCNTYTVPFIKAVCQGKNEGSERGARRRVHRYHGLRRLGNSDPRPMMYPLAVTISPM